MTTTQQDVDYFFEVAKALTIEAAKVIKENINAIKDVETKSCEIDFVTKHDREVERILFTNLSKQFPDHKLIGEETSSSEAKIPELTDSPTWIIDPIDGTTNFVHSFPHTCISIGLAINKEMEIGIIYNPSSDEMYTAKKGQGAFLNGKPIRTSSRNELKKSLVMFGASSVSKISSANIARARMHAFFEITHGVRSIGSVALSLAYVARGAVDVFQFDNPGPWDVAAGFLIVTEAGGTVIDTKGGPFDFMSPRVVAASNEALATETSKLMTEIALKIQ